MSAQVHLLLPLPTPSIRHALRRAHWPGCPTKAIQPHRRKRPNSLRLSLTSSPPAHQPALRHTSILSPITGGSNAAPRTILVITTTVTCLPTYNSHTSSVTCATSSSSWNHRTACDRPHPPATDRIRVRDSQTALCTTTLFHPGRALPMDPRIPSRTDQPRVPP
ncbi:hypothetical protein Q7P37_005926 [Cladosporium fusiforme]